MSLIEIKAVSVGQPKQIGVKNGQPVISSIGKLPVSSKNIYLSYTNLAGDQQVDTKPKPDGRQLHGGNEMAVYAYPAFYFQLWTHELGYHIGPGTLGDNLAIEGALEHQVHIGDQWSWGEAVLEVSKPRQPCYKLNLIGDSDISRAMWLNGRCGWYMRVLTPGFVPTSGTIGVIMQAKDNPTVGQVFAEKRRKAEV